jgi:branched-chain amino acid transport system ATP-binding protein
MGVLFTEHSMDVVFGQADRVLVLVRGRLLAEGTPEQIQRRCARARGVSGRGL